MRNLFSGLRDLLHQQEIEDPILPLIEINHSTFDDPIRVVLNTEDITSNGDLFTAYAFELKLLDDKSDELSPAQLAVDNTDRRIGEYLEGLAIAADEALVTCWLIVASSPDDRTVFFQDLTIQDVRADQNVATAVLADNPIGDELVPYDKFTPGTAPGLFK
ncbi:MAG: DUF1833 domain-containing protein [Candidatus Obscuribacterales bacterium]|nr:DUF1833 domain-containing protein [Candidatus Obscuribacterales bacterium]